MLLLALCAAVGIDVPTAAVAGGWLAAGIALLLLERLAARAGAGPGARAVVVGLALCNLSLQRLQANGLESALFLALLLGLLAALPAETADRKGQWRIGVLALLLGMTRPEAPLYIGLIAVARVASGRREWWSWGIFAVGWSIFVAARAAYFGAWLPAPFHVKMVFLSAPTAGERLARAGRYLYQFAQVQPGWLLLSLVGVVAAVRARRMAAPLAVAGASVAFVFVAGGDMPTFPYWRFLLPLQIVGLLLIAPLLETRAARVAALVLVLPVWFYPTQDALQRDAPRFLWTSAGQLSDLRPGRLDAPPVDRLLAVGRHLRATTSEQQWLAGRAAGKLPYAAGRPFLDLLGLTSAELVPDGPDPAAHRAKVAANIEARRPIVLTHLPEGHDDLAILRRARYVLRTAYFRADQGAWPLRALATDGALWCFAPSGDGLSADRWPDHDGPLSDDEAEHLLIALGERLTFVAADGKAVPREARAELPEGAIVTAARTATGNLHPVGALMLDRGEFPARGLWRLEAPAGRYRLWLRVTGADPRPFEIRIGKRWVTRQRITTGSYDASHLMWVPVVGEFDLEGAIEIEMVSKGYFPYLSALALEPVK